MDNELKKTDAVVIGSGPCGLFQVFELGLLGIHSVLIDSLPQIGGQCSELYPDKPIYDIPGIPVCSGQELIDQLSLQIKPFEPSIKVGEEVIQIEKKNGDYQIITNKGSSFLTKTLFIAGGVGSFQPKKMRVDNIEKYENKWLHYKVKDKQNFLGKKLTIFGGGDSALDWAIDFTSSSEFQNAGGTVTLVHRSNTFRGAENSVDKVKKLATSNKLQLIDNGRLNAFNCKGDTLTSISISTENKEISIDADHLLVFFGLSPKLGPIANWGLDITRKTINVNPENFQTNQEGIYAIGDIANYPGKKKLILSGFHEAALAAFAAKEIIEPGKKVHVQYTTTSPKLQERLGVLKK